MSKEFDALPEPMKERFRGWAEGLSTEGYPVHPEEIFAAAVLLPSSGLDVPAPVAPKVEPEPDHE